MYKWSINPVTNPNPVYSHSMHVKNIIIIIPLFMNRIYIYAKIERNRLIATSLWYRSIYFSLLERFISSNIIVRHTGKIFRC
jgi:hypothetical protein